MKTSLELQHNSRPRWLIQNVFGKNHWCTDYVNDLCETSAGFLEHLSGQNSGYMHYLCLVHLVWGKPGEVQTAYLMSNLILNTRGKAL